MIVTDIAALSPKEPNHTKHQNFSLEQHPAHCDIICISDECATINVTLEIGVKDVTILRYEETRSIITLKQHPDHFDCSQ